MSMNTFGDRLRLARKEAKLTQVVLAKMIGGKTTHTSVSDWENNKYMPDGSNTRKLERSIGVRFDWLETGQGEKYFNNNEPTLFITDYKITQYPVIDWLYVHKWSSKMDKDVEVIGEFESRCGASKESFALVVNSDNMSPEFDVGEAILIDPSEKIEHNDHVIVSLNGDETYVLRLLVADGEQFYVRSTNPDWPTKLHPIEINQVKGVVVEKWKVYKRK